MAAGLGRRAPVPGSVQSGCARERLPQLAGAAAGEVLGGVRLQLDGDALVAAGILPGDLLDADDHRGELLGVHRRLPAALVLVDAAVGPDRQHVGRAEVGIEVTKALRDPGRPDELVIAEPDAGVGVRSGRVEPHVLEDVEIGVEPERPGRLGVVALLVEDRPLNPQAEVLQAFAGRALEDGRRRARCRLVGRVDPVADEGRVAGVDALIEGQVVRLREDDGEIDVQADVPEDAEVGAQIEEIGRLRVLEVAHHLRVVAVALELAVDGGAAGVVEPGGGEVEVEGVVLIERGDDPGHLGGARGPHGDAEQRQRSKDRPGLPAESDGVQGGGDDNTRGRSSAIGRAAAVQAARDQALFLPQAQLLHLGLEALARDLELAGRLGDVAARGVERPLNELALDPLGLRPDRLLE